jgi:hypothetical protein
VDPAVSLIDRMNRAFVGWLRRRDAAPTIIGDTILIGGRQIPLTDLAGAIAYEADVHAGLAIALTLSFAGGASTTVTELDACWHDLLDALDRLRLTRTPSSIWLADLIAADGRRPPMMLR